MTDGQNGIYFMMERTINSDDMDILCHWDSSISVDIKLYHCTGWTESTDLVYNFGLFEAPKNAFMSGDTLIHSWTLVQDLVQSEHGFFDASENTEHKILFVGAGPVGGRFRMVVFNWDDTTKQALGEGDIIKKFNDNDFGGYVDVATITYFTESSPSMNSSSNCNVSISGSFALGLLALITFRKKQ